MLKQYRKPAFLFALALSAAPGFGQDPPGIVNFHEINEHIYRGAQPSLKGIVELAKLGIKTVIDLREPSDRSTTEKKAVESAGMQYIEAPLNGYHAPTGEQIAKILGYLDDTSKGPIFVHCRRGADRTGTVIACYRMTHDHWDNQKALDEARSLGMSWTERSMQNYILHYQTTDRTTISPRPAQ